MELSSSSSSSLPTTTSGTSELFICFTSRLSSSMKITSKSILSPGRAAGGRDSSQISLSSSLSRRLKTSGSLKGGQASPAMFPTTVTGNNKKRSSCSSGFENPEPSSPKVTCIGQVRVKTKKQGKKMRYRSSKRRSNNNNNNGGEASFRRAEKGGGEESEKKSFEEEQKIEENKWVTICEALRGFGAEFNCFLPCRSSCMTTKQTDNDTNKAEKSISTASTSNNGRSCGAVFARWLVALQDGDGKGREIELVVGEEEEEEDHKEEDEMKGNGRSLRRRVFEGIEFKEEEIMGGFNKNDKVGDSNNNSGDEGEEAGRVSICIPPKNALLLMRCRSDPVKMAALANRFWEPPLKDEEDEDEDAEKHEDVNEEEKCENQASEICGEKCDSSPCNDIGQRGAEEEEEKPELAEQPKMVSEKEDVEQVVVAVVEEEVVEVEEQEENTRRTSTEEEDFEVVVPEQQEDEGAEEEEKENNGDVRKEVEEEAKILVDLEEMVELEEVNESHCEEEQEIEDKEIEKEGQEEERNEKPISPLASEEVEQHQEEEEKVAEESTDEEEDKTGREDPKEKREVEMGPPGLPDCLLLMMCEPKLSMEVSKETWVCSTDFIRWLPDRRRPNAKKGGPEEPKKRPITATAFDGGGGAPMSNPVPPAQLMQPPRSSCSFPLTASVTASDAAAAPQSMARVIERKSVGTKPPYEPFVLTRCKSEPMRSAAKLAPDACFWKNRKIEPHRPATFGVGAAGVGF